MGHSEQTEFRYPTGPLWVLCAVSLIGFLVGCDSESRQPKESDSAQRLTKLPATPFAREPATTSTPGTSTDGSLHSVGLNDPGPGDAPAMFQRLAPEETGVDFTIGIDDNHPLRRLYGSPYACGGVAIGDVDGDGRADLFLVSGPAENKLYRQTDDFRFEDITDVAGVGGGDAWGLGAALIDIDNDGDLDLHVSNYDTPNALYINQGDGVFVESASQWGLDQKDTSLMAHFCDYDRDGDLDVYLLAYHYVNERSIIKDNADRLLRNDGADASPHFTDVTKSANIEAQGEGLSATWWDWDQDGWPDLYVANDFSDADHLYHNNQDGTFSEITAQAAPHTTWFSMGSDFADLNNDGLFDFFVLDMSGSTHFNSKISMGAMGPVQQKFLVTAVPRQYMRNALYLNTGTDRFMEAAYLCGLASTDWSWAAKLADFDNDGRVDALITNGHSRNYMHSDLVYDPIVKEKLAQKMPEWDAYHHTPPLRQQNLAYQNLGDLKFEDASHAWGLDHVGMSFGAAYGDLDNDGDLDLVVANLDEPVSIYRNHAGHQTGHRTAISLQGSESNRFGIGATVRIKTKQGQQVRQLMPQTGYMSANLPAIHFGTGKDKTINQLSVTWPSGHVQSFENLQADRFYTITEPAGPAPHQTRPPKPQTMFTGGAIGVKHQERPFNDYAVQNLLPYKLSQLGPGMAWGDADSDGDEDLYLGGAAGQAGTLVFNDGASNFRLGEAPALDEDRECEDMSPLWIDVDADGDQDLFVVSGGVEVESDDPHLRDRLYLNDGSGKLTRAAGVLPDLRDSGSVAAAADFDRDGDLDLFVGGRVIPASYPLPPNSRLLRNDDGKFVDVTDQLAAGLRTSGLVTGALWSDADQDGWVDLLVTHEWGPVKLFKNDQGQLVDQTENAGLASRLGWFNGIAAGDIDDDADIDYVVTNFGLNTKYHASRQSPARLFYGDFEGEGKMRLVEAEHEQDTLFPIRGKSCSTRAMPFLAEKFTTYNDFALAPLQDIFTTQCLDDAYEVTATTLESGVLINDGTGRFEFRPLPRLAQISPGFGVVLTDVNADGYKDIYLAQNFFAPQPETGHMDGGVSLLLEGTGNGEFRPVWPDESGLAVYGDAKGLTTIDYTGDGRPDFFVAVNNGSIGAFECIATRSNRVLGVRLKGKPGNLTAVGSRVTVHLEDGSQQTSEVYAGSGYLSQSTAVLTFGLGQDGQAKKVVVRWPDGNESEHAADPAAGVLELRQQ